MSDPHYFSWGEFISKVVPVFIAGIIGAGVVVKFYGDSKTKQIEQILATENARLRENITEKIEKARLETIVYVNEQMQGVLTKDLLDQLAIPIEDRVKFINDRQLKIFEEILPEIGSRLNAIDVKIKAHNDLHFQGGRSSQIRPVPGYSDDLYRAPRQ